MILLIDNYDSFTYNLVQLLREAGAPVDVVRNDVAAARRLVEPGASAQDAIHGVVISPGPGRPESAGVSMALYEANPTLPILGVCLGHQCLGASCGAVVERAPRLMHGKTSMVRFAEDPLFEGLPNPFRATRYHSLIVREDSLPDELEPIAWAEDDGTLMAIRHRDRPFWGVQFHPESVLTDAGVLMLRNFLRLAGIEVRQTAGAPLVDPGDLERAGLALGTTTAEVTA